MKGVDADDPTLDGDFRETIRRFPGLLNLIPYGWLFHDLYDHRYGLSQPALNLGDCCASGEFGWICACGTERRGIWKREPGCR